MHEATLAMVDLSSAERDLAPWGGHQQLHRPATIFRREHSVFSAGSDLQLCGSGGRGVSPLLVSGGDALPSATAFRHRPPRGRLRWSLSRLIPGGYTRVPLVPVGSMGSRLLHTCRSITRRVSAVSLGVKNKDS
jgi:hypothetical protein